MSTNRRRDSTAKDNKATTTTTKTKTKRATSKSRKNHGDDDDDENDDQDDDDNNNTKLAPATTTTTKTDGATGSASLAAGGGDDDEDWESWRCDVCKLIDATDDNPVVICERCEVPVHAQCYGSPLSINIPDDDWICDRCLDGESDQQCALCPLTTGAMKRTSDYKWAHILCSYYIPECFYRLPDALDCVDYLQVPKVRFERKCAMCTAQGGAVFTCSQPGCKTSFHITCGMKAGIYLNYVQSKKGDVVHGLCVDHTEKDRQQKARRRK